MKKTIKKTVKQKVYYCDICGPKKKRVYDYLDSCLLCDRNMCDKHSQLTPDSDPYEGYPAYICTDCLPIARPFYEKIEMLKEEYDKEESQIRDEMQAACLKNLKAKK